MGSFGDNLRRERELRGVSLREIADNTKISIRFLEALEEDRIDVLPGGLFPRSFVRQYSTFVGLDPDRTVADFLAQHGQPETEKSPPPVERRAWLSPGALFFAAVAVVAVFLVVRRPGGGYLMAVIASQIVEQTERGDEMFIAMASRHATQMADLDVADLLD